MTPRTRPCLLAAAAILFAITAAASAQSSGRTQGFATFEQLRTKNIFDPNRRAVRPSAPSDAPRPTSTRSRASSFTLTGTMVADNQTLAFFSGTRADSGRVLRVGDSVAHFKIAAITGAAVDLEHAGRRTTLPVGRSLEVQGSTDPGDSEPEPDEPAPADDQTAAANAAASSSSAPAAAPGGKDEMLRRLMERRQQELSK
jgi:hypothetical protein